MDRDSLPGDHEDTQVRARSSELPRTRRTAFLRASPLTVSKIFSPFKNKLNRGAVFHTLSTNGAGRKNSRNRLSTSMRWHCHAGTTSVIGRPLLRGKVRDGTCVYRNWSQDHGVPGKIGWRFFLSPTHAKGPSTSSVPIFGDPRAPIQPVSHRPRARSRGPDAVPASRRCCSRSITCRPTPARRRRCMPRASPCCAQ